MTTNVCLANSITHGIRWMNFDGGITLCEIKFRWYEFPLAALAVSERDCMACIAAEESFLDEEY